MMKELIGSFAGKRLAAFGALLVAIALLAAGGALSTRTADAQTMNDGIPSTEDDGYSTVGLDHVNTALTAGEQSIESLTITLTTGFRHAVCLVDNINGQQFRADSANAASGGATAALDALPVSGVSQGDDPLAANYNPLSDIDDLAWDESSADADGISIALGDVGVDVAAADDHVRGPRNVLTAAPRGNPPAIGWNWVIAKKTGSQGTPNVTNAQRRFSNAGVGATNNTDQGQEACVYWTSTAPGTQVIQLYRANTLAATGRSVLNIGRGDSTAAVMADATLQLEVTWVDADPILRVNTVATGARVTAPIAQRMVFTGAGQAVRAAVAASGTPGEDDYVAAVSALRAIPANAFEPAGGTADTDPAGVAVSVNAYEDINRSLNQLTGASVSFAVTGTCGMVTVPGAIGTGVTDGALTPGKTGAIGSWSNAVTATFSNTGKGAAACKRASSTTTLTVTSGALSETVSVNWNWDGYGDYTVEDVNDTTKKVTFHTAVPRTYTRLGAAIGWACDTNSQARTVLFDLDGRASVSGYARRNTVGTDGPTFATVRAASVGFATPRRTLGAADSECQVSWTVRSPSRASDVYLDITSLGVDSFSDLLSFAPETPAVTTFGDIERPLDPGIDYIVWTGADTPVGDAIGDSGAIAVYQWVSATQSWLTFFPNSEELGVNSLTRLVTGGIYAVSTPRN